MINLHDIRYLRLGTRNLDETCRYATQILGLQEIRKENGTVYFRSDSRDHTLCFFEGDTNQHTTAFEVKTKQDLDLAASKLDNSNFKVRLGSHEECEQRYVNEFIAFQDPSGNHIELVVRPQHSGWRYFAGRDAGITGFSHIGLCSQDVKRDEQFWTGVASAKVSDWIGDAPLLRIDEIHHKIALFPSTKPGIQHINHQVESIDDIMRAWYFLKDRGIKILFGPGRHPTSGAMFLYFEGPDGMTYEYSTGVRSITEEDEKTYVPRQFPAEPLGFCMWGSKPDIKEFKS